MIELAILERLQNIFGLRKVTFDQPSESMEQECLFVEIENSRNTVKDGWLIAKVTGNAKVYAQADKMPVGFLSQKIALADYDDTKDFFFFEIEDTGKIFQNLVSRSFRFVYFFTGQYNPVTDSISNVTFEES